MAHANTAIIARTAASLILLTVFLLPACSGSTSRAIPVPTAPEAALPENQWLSSGITDYRIRVTFDSVWHNQTYQSAIVDGKVQIESVTCIAVGVERDEPTGCKLRELDFAPFTVPDLFAIVGSRTQQPHDAACLTVEYDATYGFPRRIVYDCPGSHDEEASWIVEQFEVLR